MIPRIPGDGRTCVPELADASVHGVITSPPSWGQRAAGPPTPPDPPLAIGQERGHAGLAWPRTGLRWRAAPADGADGQGAHGTACGRRVLVPDPDAPLELCEQCDVCPRVEGFRPVRRVRRPAGTVWRTLGDAAAPARTWGGCTGGTQRAARHGPSSGRGHGKCTTGRTAQDRCGRPGRVAFARPADGGWRRADNSWHTPKGCTARVTERTPWVQAQVVHRPWRARYCSDAFVARSADLGVSHTGRDGAVLPPRPARRGTGRSSAADASGSAAGGAQRAMGQPAAGGNRMSLDAIQHLGAVALARFLRQAAAPPEAGGEG